MKIADIANIDRNMPLESVKQLLDSIQAEIYVSDIDLGTLLFCNSSQRRAAGITTHGGRRPKCYKAVYGRKTACPQCPVPQLRGSSGAPQKTMVENTATGRIYQYNDCIIEWPGKGRAHIRYALDVTEQEEAWRKRVKKLRHDSIRQGAKQALEQSRAKSEFLSQVSHEIRTPLNIIIGMLQIAQDTDEKELIKHYLRQLEPATNSLLDIINDVLDISRIEADKAEVRREDFVFEDLLRDVFGSMGAYAELKDIHFVTQIAPGIPYMLKGDPQNIALILKNLLSNAIKFTPPGGVVELAVSPGSATDTHMELHYTVSDTGIGLSEDTRRRLFLPFEQGDDTIVRKYGGSGLGLNIAQRTAQLLHSEITVESTAGQGSRFAFCTPLEKADGDNKNPRGKLLAGANILLASDGGSSAPMLIAYLQACGATVHTASHPRQIGETLGSGTAIHAVVVDFALSKQDELAITRAACRRLPPSQVVFVTSGPGTTEKIGAALKLGVKHVYTRPVLYVEMAAAVCDIMGAGGPSVTAGFEYPDYSGKTILLAEDIPLNRTIIRQFLGKTNAALAEAENGDVALHMYKEAPGLYQVILMDVKMPVLDGYDATVAIRAYEAGRGIGRVPIIALTASAYEEDRRRCLTAGMDGYLVKPLQKKQLIGEIGKYLLHSPQTAAPSPLPADAAAGPTDTLIDVEGSMERMMDDRQFYLELLDDFLKTDDLSQIEAAWSKKDYPTLLNQLHSLKGVAGNYGLEKLLCAAKTLEDTLYDKGDAQEEYQRFTACFAQTNRAIAALLRGTPG